MASKKKPKISKKWKKLLSAARRMERSNIFSVAWNRAEKDLYSAVKQIEKSKSHNAEA